MGIVLTVFSGWDIVESVSLGIPPNRLLLVVTLCLLVATVAIAVGYAWGAALMSIPVIGMDIYATWWLLSVASGTITAGVFIAGILFGGLATLGAFGIVEWCGWRVEAFMRSARRPSTGDPSSGARRPLWDNRIRPERDR